MVIKDEFLPQQLERQCDQEESVWRIVGVEDVEAMSPAEITANHEACGSEVEVFTDVPQESLELQKQPPESSRIGRGRFLEQLKTRHAINSDSINDFE